MLYLSLFGNALTLILLLSTSSSLKPYVKTCNITIIAVTVIVHDRRSYVNLIRMPNQIFNPNSLYKIFKSQST